MKVKVKVKVKVKSVSTVICSYLLFYYNFFDILMQIENSLAIFVSFDFVKSFLNIL